MLRLRNTYCPACECKETTFIVDGQKYKSCNNIKCLLSNDYIGD